MAAGSISVSQYQEAVEQFIQRSNKINDLWVLRKSPEGDVPYLSKREPVLCHTNQNISSDEELDCEVKDEEEVSRVYTSCTTYTYDYHIVYSPAYAVPVLYFNAYHSDGRLLRLDEVWENVRGDYRERLEEHRWSMVTQQEHPVLGRPFYQLHPCHTADLMRPFCESGVDVKRYLVTWLSSVGPAVNLDVPVAYADC